jgi:hypothetical protein
VLHSAAPRILRRQGTLGACHVAHVFPARVESRLLPASRPDNVRYRGDTANEGLTDFKVLLEPDETGGYVATCPSLPGCYSQGDTVDGALDNIREAIELCLEDT